MAAELWELFKHTPLGTELGSTVCTHRPELLEGHSSMHSGQKPPQSSTEGAELAWCLAEGGRVWAEPLP